jgi:catechol 2,3-dioxygenase-like lactoylglutathione lyase family enzyme
LGAHAGQGAAQQPRHVHLGVADLLRDHVLVKVVEEPQDDDGAVWLKVESEGVAFGADGMDDFAIFAGARPTTGAHVAFDAPSREAVDAFCAAALEHGGRRRGAPGVWVQYSQRYYAAYVWDPDGNDIEAVFHSPEPLTGVAPIRRPEEADEAQESE